MGVCLPKRGSDRSRQSSVVSREFSSVDFMGLVFRCVSREGRSSVQPATEECSNIIPSSKTLDPDIEAEWFADCC